MKKFTILLCAALLLTLPACAAKQEEQENPYRIQTITFEYFIRPNSPSSQVYDYSYNETGDIITMTVSSDGNLVDITTYEQDEFGNVFRTTVERDGEKFVEDHVLTLDEQHRITFCEDYQDGELTATHENAYDNNGNQTMLNIVRMEDGEPQLTSWMDMTYDKNGNIIRDDVRWSDGKANYTLYEYENERLMRKECYNSHDFMTSYTIYSYDETGLEITSVSYDPNDTPTYKNISIFDEYDNLLSAEYFWYNESTSTFELVQKRTCTYEPIPTT